MPKYYTAGIIREYSMLLSGNGSLHLPDKYLLIKHIKRDAWFFPGGKPEGTESLEDCLARELKEEIAIIVHSMAFHATYFRDLDNIQHVGFFFDIISFSGTPKIKEPHKHSGLEWMTFEEMGKVVVPKPEMGIAKWYEEQLAHL